ncbi:MAG: hypothetical protein JO288_10385 [Hyphomicrobiales bacterium]|nr:hypothetical protein [Hyphomicrobiales bacterium]
MEYFNPSNIAQFETSTGHRDFAAFHYEQARRFKRVLDEWINPETGKPLAKATIYSRLMAVKAFLLWLAGHTTGVSQRRAEAGRRRRWTRSAGSRS